MDQTFLDMPSVGFSGTSAASSAMHEKGDKKTYSFATPYNLRKKRACRMPGNVEELVKSFEQNGKLLGAYPGERAKISEILLLFCSVCLLY